MSIICTLQNLAGSSRYLLPSTVNSDILHLTHTVFAYYMMLTVLSHSYSVLLESLRLLRCFLKLVSSTMLHVFDQKYSKSCNIVKYFHFK